MTYFVLLITIYSIFMLAVLGPRRSGYSHVRHTISELGATGNSIGTIVSYGYFLPVGIGMTIIARCQPNDAVALLAGSLAVGYVGSAFFPIDDGAPLIGSWRNSMHSLVGACQLGGSIIAFSGLGNEYGFPYNVFSGIIITFVFVLYLPRVREIRGLHQRVMELGTFLALALVVE